MKDKSIAIKRRKERLIQLIALDAPDFIIGHAAMLLAEAALPCEMGWDNHKGLIKWLLDWDAQVQEGIKEAENDPIEFDEEEQRVIEELKYSELNQEIID